MDNVFLLCLLPDPVWKWSANVLPSHSGPAVINQDVTKRSNFTLEVILYILESLVSYFFHCQLKWESSQGVQTECTYYSQQVVTKKQQEKHLSVCLRQVFQRRFYRRLIILSRMNSHCKHFPWLLRNTGCTKRVKSGSWCLCVITVSAKELVKTCCETGEKWASANGHCNSMEPPTKDRHSICW